MIPLAKRSLGALASVVALLAVSPAALGAQNERAAEVHHRDQCRLAGQVLATGHPAPKREWARAYITSCAEEGPRLLAEQWHTAGADSAQLRYLVTATARLRDRRLYDALQAVASDRSRPRGVRVGAMLALTRYVDPHSAVWFSDLRAPGEPVRRIPLVTSWTTGGGQMDGSQPIAAPVADSVLRLLDEIAAARAAEPLDVWYAAAVLAKRVRADVENGRAL